MAWAGAPTTTRSFALVCDDPDVPKPQPFVHWVIYNVATIPCAQKTGRLKVVTEAHVTKIETDRQGRVTGVTYVTGKEEFLQPAKVVLLSTSKPFPTPGRSRLPT